MPRHAYREANWEAKYCGVVWVTPPSVMQPGKHGNPPTPSMICWKVVSLWTKPHDIRSNMFCVAVGLATPVAQPAAPPGPADVAPNRFSQYGIGATELSGVPAST